MAAKLQVVGDAPKIEMGVPMPIARQTFVGDVLRELAAAPIGASVLFPPATNRTTIQQSAWRLGGRGWITIKATGDGARVWKIAEPQTRA